MKGNDECHFQGDANFWKPEGQQRFPTLSYKQFVQGGLCAKSQELKVAKLSFGKNRNMFSTVPGMKEFTHVE